MRRSVDEIVRLFSSKGLNITPQRRLIFNLLAGDESHPTVEEIFRRARGAMPDISMTTVYSTLRELVGLGVLSEVEDLGDAGRRYDTNTGGHHHLCCVGCHALRDIEGDFGGLDLPAEEADGFKIIKSRVTFFGYCPECGAKE